MFIKLKGRRQMKNDGHISSAARNLYKKEAAFIKATPLSKF
jgi:hypothetical protein